VINWQNREFSHRRRRESRLQSVGGGAEVTVTAEKIPVWLREVGTSNGSSTTPKLSQLPEWIAQALICGAPCVSTYLIVTATSCDKGLRPPEVARDTTP